VSLLQLLLLLLLHSLLLHSLAATLSALQVAAQL
jgi:hypothetical protein